MGKTGKKELKRLFLEYLCQTTNGSANVEEICNSLNFPILMVDAESTLEDLENQGLIKLHKQFRSPSEPKYDKVVILDAGREFLNI